MDRNLALEFVRVTEAAAISAASWIGRGEKKKADGAAVDEMRDRLNQIDFGALVVIGEGRKDEAPELYIGEKLGTRNDNIFDIAVDPLECTESVAWGRPNAISVIAAAPRGTIFQAPDMHMQKIAVGPKVAGKIDLDYPVEKNLKIVSQALEKPIQDLMVMILERDYNKKTIDDVRRTGARITFITDGDVAGAIAPSLDESGIDILLGIGATAEGVLAACALKSLGGEIQGRLAPFNKEEINLAKELGIKNIEKKLKMNDLINSDQTLFVATGIVDGPMLKGVRFKSDFTLTHSVAMRSKSKTIRYIEAYHKN